MDRGVAVRNLESAGPIRCREVVPDPCPSRRATRGLVRPVAPDGRSSAATHRSIGAILEYPDNSLAVTILKKGRLARSGPAPTRPTRTRHRHPTEPRPCPAPPNKLPPTAAMPSGPGGPEVAKGSLGSGPAPSSMASPAKGWPWPSRTPPRSNDASGPGRGPQARRRAPSASWPTAPAFLSVRLDRYAAYETAALSRRSGPPRPTTTVTSRLQDVDERAVKWLPDDRLVRRSPGADPEDRLDAPLLAPDWPRTRPWELLFNQVTRAENLLGRRSDEPWPPPGSTPWPRPWAAISSSSTRRARS